MIREEVETCGIQMVLWKWRAGADFSAGLSAVKNQTGDV